MFTVQCLFVFVGVFLTSGAENDGSFNKMAKHPHKIFFSQLACEKNSYDIMTGRVHFDQIDSNFEKPGITKLPIWGE